MRFLAIIILFLLAVLGSTLLAKFILRGNLEVELERRALAVLAEAGYKGVEVKFDHLDAALGGYVDSLEAPGKVVALLREKLPAAYWPDPAATSIAIRPSLPPRLVVTRRSGSDTATLEGVLASSDEGGRAMLASRLHALPEIGGIENRITFDPRQLPFPKMAEFASLSAGLLTHSDAVRLTLQDGILTMDGTVPNEGIRASLLDLAERIGAERAVDHIVVEAPELFLRSAEFKLTRNRFGITLNGVLPADTDKAAVLAVLRSVRPAPEISDRITVSDDRAPAPWQVALPEVLPVLLRGLSGEMTAEFSESQIRLHGISPDQKSFGAMKTALATLGEFEPAVEIVNEISVAPPEEGSVGRQTLLAVYEGGLLVLSGALSDATLPGRIEETLANVLPDLSVKNEVGELAAQSAHPWTARLPDFFAEALPRLQSATFRFEGDRLEMEGRTLALPDKQILQNVAVNTVPTHFTIQNDLLHVDAPVPKPPLTSELRATIDAALEEFPLYFEIGSEVLREEETAKVAALVEVLKKVNAEFNLVVTGVSDHRGNEEKNRELSLRRAGSVVAEIKRLVPELAAIETTARIENVSDLPRSQHWKARRVDVTLAPAAVSAPEP